MIANGTATDRGIWPRTARSKTQPKLTTMTGYGSVQIGPMVSPSDVRLGFASVSYHSIHVVVGLHS